MAARRGVQGLTEALNGLSLSPRAASKTLSIRLASLSRSMATEAAATTSAQPTSSSPLSQSSSTPPTSTVVPIADRTVPVTVFAFPSLEPRALEHWSAQHLHLPLRRDLLHLAVVYEGDNTRQGTASSKTRWDVRGSHRKMRPQKGTGSARVGTRQSPLLRGGGKVFGPHPRDFGTQLNRKVYDRAWRTALSYRYRRGELFVCQDGMELPLPEAFLRLASTGTLDRTLEDGFVRRYVRTLLNGPDEENYAGLSTLGSIGQAWGRSAGRTTFITSDRRPNLFTSLEASGEDGRAMAVADVDVKDLLETGRLVIERSALCEIIERHQSDLVSRVFINGVQKRGPPVGHAVVE